MQQKVCLICREDYICMEICDTKDEKPAESIWIKEKEIIITLLWVCTISHPAYQKL